MSLAVRLRPEDPTPPFEQLRSQIAAAITSGDLPTGWRLPTVRQLAGDLGVAAGTVARSYRELEAAGLVVTARGAGTRVAPLTAQPVQTQLEQLTASFVEQAHRLGASDRAIQDEVARRLRR